MHHLVLLMGANHEPNYTEFGPAQLHLFCIDSLYSSEWMENDYKET